MAKIVEYLNPITGAPEQVDQLDHSAQEIDDAVGLAPQLSNPNLLDNWYFGNPVNQRNVSGAIDAVGYFLDRWKLVSGSVTIGSNGIILNGTIVQILETAVGTDVTASALTTEGVVVASYDNNSKTISLTGTGQTFVAAKLELGSQQTLAHQDADGNWVLNEIPDYGEQLRRCQRYQLVINREIIVAGRTSASVETTCFAFIPTPVTMRVAPAISKIAANYIATVNHVNGNKSITDFTSVSLAGNGIYVTGAITAGLGTNQPITVTISGCIADANL